MNYDWMREVKDFSALPDEYREVIRLIGVDNFITLLCTFDKTDLYFSDRLVFPLAVKFINDHPGVNPKELARILKINVRRIYKIRGKKLTSRRLTGAVKRNGTGNA